MDSWLLNLLERDCNRQIWLFQPSKEKTAINLSLSHTLEEYVTLLLRRFVRLKFLGQQGRQATSFSIRSWIFFCVLYIQSPGHVIFTADWQTKPVLLFVSPQKKNLDNKPALLIDLIHIPNQTPNFLWLRIRTFTKDISRRKGVSNGVF